MWWVHDPGWDGWVMTVGMGGFWVLLALLVVTILRGEFDAQEYLARLGPLSRASG